MRLMQKRQRGASGLTYGILIGLVSVVAITSITRAGGSVNRLFGTVAGRIFEARPVDANPDGFSFATTTAASGSTVTSGTAVITGITVPVTLTVSGGGSPGIRVGSGGFGPSVTVNNGDVIQLQMTAGSPGTTQTATVTGGGLSVTWSVQALVATLTFGTCGATGPSGPAQAACNTAYAGTPLAGTVSVDGFGRQSWTVPLSGIYRIEASGAAGGANSGFSPGAGATVRGDVTLSAGTVLTILVG